MIDLLSIQETSRTGSPPKQSDVKDAGFQDDKFGEYLKRQDSTEEVRNQERVSEKAGNGNERVNSGTDRSDTSEAGTRDRETEVNGKKEKVSGGKKTSETRLEKPRIDEERNFSDKKVSGKSLSEKLSEKILKAEASRGKDKTSPVKTKPGSSDLTKSGETVLASGGAGNTAPAEKLSSGDETSYDEAHASLEAGEMLAEQQDGAEEGIAMKGFSQFRTDSDNGAAKKGTKQGLDTVSVGGVKVLNPDKQKKKNGALEITLKDERASSSDKVKLPKGRIDFSTERNLKSAAETDRGNGIQGADRISESAEDKTDSPIRVIELDPVSERENNVQTLSMKKSDFAGTLKNLIRDKAVPDIVKQTGILLKDANQGEIRLILRPEALGKVRIRLNLDENNIAGRIFVENINVKDAFNSTLEELQRALRDSGFNAANLEVSVQGDGAGESRGRDDRPVFVHPAVIENIEENIPLADSINSNDARVNLLA